jgi:hypothetical protein
MHTQCRSGRRSPERVMQVEGRPAGARH